MTKKLLLSVFLFAFIFLASGCTLVKGVGGAISGFGQGAAEGFQRDANLFKKADNWTKDNLW